jgi:malate dehydrogenase (oxaloacetate-decarboxylating)
MSKINDDENNKKAIEIHAKMRGKLETVSKMKLDDRESLSLAYTPGVGAVSQAIADDPEKVYEYTLKGRTVAVVTDGSAVLGLGNIGPEAALPVMEGKAAIFKEFAGIDAFPICLDTQDTEEIIETVKRIAPTFGGVNLEDISAPRCFEIEQRLQDIGIPVFHDDQHGTATVTLAGLFNATKVVGKELSDMRIVISGAGAAGVSIAKLLKSSEVQAGEVIVCDSKAIISKDRDDLNEVKKSLLEYTNKNNISGELKDALKDADVFIGVSAPGVVTQEMVRSMNSDPIIFALSNPVPEIFPDEAKEAGASVVATGRSDFPNQVNNALIFPGIFKGALEIRAKRITEKMEIAAAIALADLVPKPQTEKILPDVFEKTIASVIAKAVSSSAGEEKK